MRVNISVVGFGLCLSLVELIKIIINEAVKFDKPKYSLLLFLHDGKVYSPHLAMAQTHPHLAGLVLLYRNITISTAIWRFCAF